ncbi:MAG: sulfatase [Deltaproteobacteria bacterium]|nr:sulfatase [Deltaproteobacteria bacterium]
MTARPRNIVLLVVDSLRASALTAELPFFARLARESVHFRRAYASECWTLPTHLSLFTGLLPSEHGAHFQTMAYTRTAPTIAEILAGEGFHTEVVTRNPVFDGTLPGVTRGFGVNTRVLSPRSGLNPLSLLLAASKPRFRQQIMSSGFFHPRQRASREFLTTFAQATLPADREALRYLLEQLDARRTAPAPAFFFLNLYDVHAPYPPAPDSIFRSPWSRRGLDDLLRMPLVMPKLGGHRYLQRGFRMSNASRRMLLERYRDAVRLMDAKLAEFYEQAQAAGLLDDTLLIVTSDHGEAFGEHGLYLHDASVYDTHLHVPLFVRHPDRSPGAVDDVVSTRDLFGLMRAAPRGRWSETILDTDYRAQRPVAVAEHFHYPRLRDARAEYRQDLVALIGAERKLILRGAQLESYDLTADPHEQRPSIAPRDDLEPSLRRLSGGGPLGEKLRDHLARWRSGPARVDDRAA